MNKQKLPLKARLEIIFKYKKQYQKQCDKMKKKEMVKLQKEKQLIRLDFS